jgi:catechol 2,3-dioxygenase-like lactoylglutathione lyase family enzyme
MLLNHIGIINRTEEQAVKFYRDFLGFEITKKSLISPELSEQVFSLSQEIKMLVFERDGIKLEVFILPECNPIFPDFRHTGLLLDDFSALLEKAEKSGVEVIEGKTREKTVYFIKDFSGNLIEIKQR